MLSEKIVASINEQINKEIYSGYLYLSMAAYSTSIGLNGFANWFTIQLQEELSHARKFYDYLKDKKGRIILSSIDEPPKDFEGPRDLFFKTLKHEQMVTKRIDGLVELAKKEKDSVTEKFLQWFVAEQVEEEENASKILHKFDPTGKDKDVLLKIDSELALRSL
ncbi:ferritin [Candidatus Omnitrophota bacterium]